MAAERITFVDQPDRVRLALSPIRRKLLERLQTPGSATQLASELTLGRQRVNYHLRALEAAALIELVEERQRRGCVERMRAARARAFVVDPAVIVHTSGDGQVAARRRECGDHDLWTERSCLRDPARPLDRLVAQPL